MINNLWEQSNIQANCEICGVDEPFYMPVNRTDMLALRLVIPYHLVTANGGGLPVGSNVRISIVDETDSVTLCDFGNLATGKLMWSRLNDSTTKHAEYQFYMPIGMANELNQVYSQKYVDVNDGQYLEISGSGTDADGGFTYGVDQTPAIFQEIKAGRLVFPYITPGIGLSVTIDGVVATLGNPYSVITSCPHENFDCWRVKVSVAFPSSGVTKYYYTKPFKVSRSCDDSLMIAGKYSVGVTDCNGYVHNGTMTPNVADVNRLFLRIPAMLSQTASRVKKTYNDKCFSVRGERQQSYRLNSEPVPSWFASEAENIMLGNEFLINNMELQLPDNDQIFQGVDIPGYTYQFLDVPLTSCKCLMLYGC